MKTVESANIVDSDDEPPNLGLHFCPLFYVISSPLCVCGGVGGVGFEDQSIICTVIVVIAYGGAYSYGYCHNCYTLQCLDT